MSPASEYRRLNKLIWFGRLPDATLVLVDNATIPYVHGVTCHNTTLFVKPVIVLNRTSPWRRTLIHEMLHVAEPELPHGAIFDSIVRRYTRLAQKAHKKIQKSKVVSEGSHVE